MKFVLIGLVVVIAVRAGAIVCPAYNCDATLGSKVCAYKTNTLVKLQACSSTSQYCPITLHVDGMVNCTDITGLLPGDYCLNNTQCLSGICTGNQCIGAKTGDACNSDSNCGAGMYCNSNVCTAVASIGDVCTSDNMCDPTGFCSNGKCTAFAQLAEGIASTVALACATFYTNGTHCVTGPKFSNSANYTCPADGTCYYNYNGEKFAKACVCGKSKTTSGFCKHGRGDFSLQDVRSTSSFICE